MLPFLHYLCYTFIHNFYNMSPNFELYYPILRYVAMLYLMLQQCSLRYTILHLVTIFVRHVSLCTIHSVRILCTIPYATISHLMLHNSKLKLTYKEYVILKLLDVPWMYTYDHLYTCESPFLNECMTLWYFFFTICSFLFR